MSKHLALVLPVLLLGGCNSQAEQTADQLDTAAVQANPAAAAVMENEADAIRNGATELESGDPNSPAQSAMENAGQAQLGTPAQPQSEGETPPSPRGPASTTQAQPNRGARETPPPQTR